MLQKVIALQCVNIFNSAEITPTLLQMCGRCKRGTQKQTFGVIHTTYMRGPLLIWLVDAKTKYFFNKYCVLNDWMSRLMLKINIGYIWLPQYSLITVMRDIIINELFVIYVNTRLYSVQCCVIIVMDLNFRLKEDKKSWIESRLKRKE